jgi:hypothetical protein
VGAQLQHLVQASIGLGREHGLGSMDRGLIVPAIRRHVGHSTLVAAEPLLASLGQGQATGCRENPHPQPC